MKYLYFNDQKGKTMKLFLVMIMVLMAHSAFASEIVAKCKSFQDNELISTKTMSSSDLTFNGNDCLYCGGDGWSLFSLHDSYYKKNSDGKLERVYIELTMNVNVSKNLVRIGFWPDYWSGSGSTFSDVPLVYNQEYNFYAIGILTNAYDYKDNSISKIHFSCVVEKK